MSKWLLTWWVVIGWNKLKRKVVKWVRDKKQKKCSVPDRPRGCGDGPESWHPISVSFVKELAYSSALNPAVIKKPLWRKDDWTLGVHFENARKKHNYKVCVCLFRLATVYSLYLKQLAHFILYLFLFGDYCEKAVTVNFRIKRTICVFCSSLFVTTRLPHGLNET